MGEGDLLLMNAQDDLCSTERSHRRPPHPGPPARLPAWPLICPPACSAAVPPAFRPPFHNGSGDKRRFLYLPLTRLTEFSVVCVEPVGIEGFVVGGER